MPSRSSSSCTRSGPAWTGVRSIIGGVPGTVRDGVRLGVGDPLLRRLMVRAGLLGVVLAGIELLAPGTFAALLGGEAQASRAYGIFAAAAFGASAAGCGPRAGRRHATRLPGPAPPPSPRSRPASPCCWSAPRSSPRSGPVYIGVYLLLGIDRAAHLGAAPRAVSRRRSGRRSSRSNRWRSRSAAWSRTSALGAIVVATSLGWGFACIAVALFAVGRPARRAAVPPQWPSATSPRPIAAPEAG